MRSRAIVIAVCVAAVAAAALSVAEAAVSKPAQRPAQRTRALPRIGELTSVRNGAAEALSCASCQKLVATAINLTATSAGRSTVTGILDFVCKMELPKYNLSKYETLCEDVAKDLVDVVPLINKGLGVGLAWDVPKGFCSVFVPVCKQPCCSAEAPTAPQERHLSLTRSTSEMAVTWITLDNTTTSTVQWGPAPASSPSSLPFSANGAANQRTYTNGGWVGSIHTAVMTGLKPDTQYAYRVGDAAGGWSDVVTFYTLPADIGSTERPLRMVQIGDTGWGDASNETIATLTRLVESRAFDVLLHVGDIGYADGYESNWDVYMRKVEAISSRVPYMTTPGNHELWFDFMAYKQRFWMPTPVAGEPRPPAADTRMYYSLDIGPLHLVMYDTETWYDTANIDAAQLAWIKQDLAAAAKNRATRPWVIGAGHRPLYCSDSGSDCGIFADWLRYLVEDTFYDNRVDLVIQCHVHAMERSFPIYNKKVVQTNYTNPTAPVYMLNGAGGNREGNSDPKSASWVGFRSADRGYALITIAGPSSLNWKFVQNNGTVLDEITITRDASVL